MPGGRTTSTSRCSARPSPRGSSRKCISRAIRCLPSTRSTSGTPEGARERLISTFSLDVTEPGFALGYVFDIVLRGPQRRRWRRRGEPQADAVADRRPIFRLRPDGSPVRLSAQPIASSEIADPPVPGEHIEIIGQVLDGAGKPIPDAMIEIWQADSEGPLRPPRRPAGLEPALPRLRPLRHGHAAGEPLPFRTVKPGSVDGEQAPHVNVIIFMRGCSPTPIPASISPTRRRRTPAIPVLLSVPEERRATLIARREESRRHAGLSLRHPHAGRRRDRLLRHLRSDGRFLPSPRRSPQPPRMATASPWKASRISFLSPPGTR